MAEMKGRGPMVLELVCECGFVACGAVDTDVVPVAQEHARTVHAMDLPADAILARLRREQHQDQEERSHEDQ